MASANSFRNEQGAHTPCEVIRRGGKNTRVQLSDGTSRLVPTASVDWDDEETQLDDPNRVVPNTPLERLYRSFRCVRGNRMSRFRHIERSLEGRNGPMKATFLSELFARSVAQAAFYRNVEPFYGSDTRRRSSARDELTFAPQLVRRLDQTASASQIGSFSVSFVDHEIFPFRTTRSCDELGNPATRLGAGGMDLLLRSEHDSLVLPAVGEVKAASEHVGPTFAIVQSLMYASQLTTRNQADRLQEQYPDSFAVGLMPRCDIFILLEEGPPKNSVDQDYAINLAKELMETKVSDHIRSITIAACGNNDLNFRKICSFIATR